MRLYIQNKGVETAHLDYSVTGQEKSPKRRVIDVPVNWWLTINTVTTGFYISQGHPEPEEN